MHLKISNLPELESLHGKSISFINPYSFWVLNKNNFNFELIDIWLSDGFLIGKIMSFFGYKVSRFSFDYTSVANIVFPWCKENKKKLAIIGSTDSNIKYFTTQIFDRFNFKPSTWRNGFFSDTEYIAYLNKLSTLAPDVVVIGMGTPRQEQFLLDLRATGWNGIGFTCGGFIHQTNLNKGDYYPAILDRLNLRFAYRMWREPSTIKRYLFNYPSSIVLFISGLLSKKISGPR